MKLLLDEMLPPDIAKALRASGVDVLAIAEDSALRGTPDQEVLGLAAEQERVLVTDNIKDFAPLDGRWAAQGRTHGGILFISSRSFPQDRSRKGRIVAALEKRLQGDTWPPPGQTAFL